VVAHVANRRTSRPSTPSSSRRRGDRSPDSIRPGCEVHVGATVLSHRERQVILVRLLPNPATWRRSIPVEGCAGRPRLSVVRPRCTRSMAALPVLIHGMPHLPDRESFRRCSTCKRFRYTTVDGAFHRRQQVGFTQTRWRAVDPLRIRLAKVSTSHRSRQCRRCRGVPGCGHVCVRLPRAYRATSWCTDRLPAVRPQRSRRAGVHAAAHVQEDPRAPTVREIFAAQLVADGLIRRNRSRTGQGDVRTHRRSAQARQGKPRGGA